MKLTLNKYTGCFYLMLKKVCFPLGFICTCIFYISVLSSCKEDKISHRAEYAVVFSVDTLSFDTLFTNVGSYTQSIRLYNPHPHAVKISGVWFESSGKGEKSYFRANIDGENDLSKMSDIVVFAHDSAYLFISVFIDSTEENIPLFIEDNLYVKVNGNISSLHLEAIGLNVIRIRSKSRLSEYEDFTFDNLRPYLIFDTMVVNGSLQIKEGATLYMHTGAQIFAFGNVMASGTLDKKIKICGDRLDKFRHDYISDDKRVSYTIPYSFLAGQWDGIYLLCDTFSTVEPYYLFNYVEVIGANNGLFCKNTHASFQPRLELDNSRIHVCSGNGLFVRNLNATIYNVEISNCGMYGLYVYGGNLYCDHSTLANYYEKSDIPIRVTKNSYYPALRIVKDSLNTSTPRIIITNSVISGNDSNSLQCDSLLMQDIAVRNSYLRCDSFTNSRSVGNIFMQGQKDTNSVFLHNNLKYSEYYYDFHLDSISPARGIGDSTYSIDRDGNVRNLPSDAGCYQYVEKTKEDV